MRRNELDVAVEWAADEGWNPGHRDADIFWAADPGGFVVATLDDAVVATGSIVSYGGELGFMGFFIVRPDWRGQGVGGRFWTWRRDRLRGRLNAGAPIGMDGVFDMQDWYARGGFAFSHRNLRMEGVGRASRPAGFLTELSGAPFAEVAAYDARRFGCRRDAFLGRWIEQPGALALGAVDGDRLTGYGVVRPCRRGYKIGPLFADDPATARALMDALSDRACGEPLFLDTPENNPEALALAREHEMSEVFGCARMYLGEVPPLPWDAIYGVTSFELG